MRIRPRHKWNNVVFHNHTGGHALGGGRPGVATSGTKLGVHMRWEELRLMPRVPCTEEVGC